MAGQDWGPFEGTAVLSQHRSAPRPLRFGDCTTYHLHVLPEAYRPHLGPTDSR